MVRHAYLLDIFPLSIVQTVHVSVDVMQADILIEVRLQVFHGSDLAHRLTHASDNEMAEDDVIDRIEAYLIVDTVQNGLGHIKKCPVNI